MAAGDFTAGHARVIAASSGRVGRKVGREQREEAGADRLAHARLFEPEQARKVAKHLEYVLDPNGPEPNEQAARVRRSLPA